MEFKAERESFSMLPMTPAPSRPRLSWDEWAAATPDPDEQEFARRFADRVVAIVNMDESLFRPQGLYTDDISPLEQYRICFSIARWRLREILVICGVQTSPALARIGWRCSENGPYVAPYTIANRSPHRKWIQASMDMCNKPRPLDPYVERLKRAGLYIEGSIGRLPAGMDSPRDTLSGRWDLFTLGDGSTVTVFICDPVPGQGRFIPLRGAGAVD